ncbi:hypothetical protein HMPREF9607_00029 [Cutibacterium modestum HL044PA1]|uniref:Uncharacterized protein n=1 Tax=Cutibacterium modestum HL044PA1 TaxID=765109 RepID=A0ABN0C8Z6_9ACTN|nr:hypothetical protein HMPREF9607_00029 [Cutibacterium modestum HL044PA1]
MGQFQVPLWIHGHRCQGANAVCEPPERFCEGAIWHQQWYVSLCQNWW